MAGYVAGAPTAGTPMGEPPEEEPLPTNLWDSATGFVGNVASGATDIASGLWKMGGMVVSDVGNAIGDLADLDPGEADFVMDDIAKIAFGIGNQAQVGVDENGDPIYVNPQEMGSAVWNDYQQRYGGGGQSGVAGWGANTLVEMWRNPLAFISDALMVATAGGYGAAKGAQALGKVSNVADDVAKIGLAAQGVEGAADDVGRLAKIVNAVQGNAERIVNPVTGKLEVIEPSFNAARRLMYQRNYLRWNSRSTPWLEAKAAKYAKLVDGGGPEAAKAQLALERYSSMLNEALRTGATRVYTGKYANMAARKWVDKTVGLATGRSGKVAEEVIKAYDEHLADAVRKGLITEEDMALEMQRINPASLTSDPIVAREGKGIRRAEQDVGPVDSPATIERDEGVWGLPDSELAKPKVPESRASANMGDRLFSDEVLSGNLTRISDKALEGAEDLGNGYYLSQGDAAGRAVIREAMDETKPTFASTKYIFHRNAEGKVDGIVAVHGEGEGGYLSTFVDPSARGQGIGMGLYEAGQKGGVNILDTTGRGIVSTGGEALANKFRMKYDPALQPAAGEIGKIPKVGEPGRAMLDQALETARENVRTVTPKLRDRLKGRAKVIAGKVKDERSIRGSAVLRGTTWHNVEDIQRWRIVAEDGWEGKGFAEIQQALIEETGGKVIKVENSVNNPLPTGERGIRVVMRMPDGSPAEFHIVTGDALRVLDATEGSRQVLKALATKVKLGTATPDDLTRIKVLERDLQSLWENTTDGLRARYQGQTQNSELRWRMNEFRIAQYKNTTDQLLRMGVLDPISAFENKYLAMRLAHGAERVKLDNGQWEVRGVSALDLDDALAKSGEMAPMYFPHMDPARMPAHGTMLTRGGGSVHQVSDVNLKKNTAKLAAEMAYSTDARRVWEIRAAQSARMQESIDLIHKMVREYGRPLEHINDLKPGEELFAPQLLKSLHGQHEMFLDTMAKDPTGLGLMEVIDEASARNAEYLKSLVNGGVDTEVWAVPKYVADRMRKHGSMKFGENVDIMFRTPTQLWKSFTLAGRPAWMVNNIFSNIIFLKLQGGKLTDVLKQLDRRYLERMREAIGKEALEQIEGNQGVYGSLGKNMKRTYDTSDGTVSQIADVMQRRVAQSRPGLRMSQYSEWIRGVNSGIEDAFRRASYLSAAERRVAQKAVLGHAKRFWQSNRRLEHAFNAGLDERTWVDSIKDMNKVMNDYETMSPLERNVIRPYLVPFMAFYKHAGKLLLTMPFEHPAKAQLFMQMQNVDEFRLDAAGLENENMPGWMNNDMFYRGGRTEAGDLRFLNGGGLNPFNAVTDAPLNTMHPMWKVLYEQSTGRSAFTNKRFTDPNVQTPFGSEQQFRIDPDTGQAVPIETVAPGLLEHLLQQVPQYNMVKDAIAGGNNYDTTTLIGALTGEDIPLNPETGEPLKPSSIVKEFARLFGYSETPMDAYAMQQKLIEQRAAAVQQYMNRVNGTSSSSSGGYVAGAPV